MNTSISLDINTTDGENAPHAVSGRYRVMTTADYTAARAAVAGDAKDTELLDESSVELTGLNLNGAMLAVAQDLTPSTAYTVIVEVTGATGTTTEVAEVTTAATTPQLDMTIATGTHDGTYSSNYIYVTAVAPTAVSAMAFYTDETRDDLSDTDVELVGWAGKPLTADQVAKLTTTGFGMNVSDYEPGQKAVVIIKITDADGISTVKSLSVNTTATDRTVSLSSLFTAGQLIYGGDIHDAGVSSWQISLTNDTELWLPDFVLEFTTDASYITDIPTTGTYTVATDANTFTPGTWVPGAGDAGSYYMGYTDQYYLTSGTMTIRKSTATGSEGMYIIGGSLKGTGIVVEPGRAVSLQVAYTNKPLEYVDATQNSASMQRLLHPALKQAKAVTETVAKMQAHR